MNLRNAKWKREPKKSNSNRGQWYYRAHSAHDECFGCGRRWDARKWLCWDCIYTTILSTPSPPCIHTTATRRICMDELSGIFSFFFFIFVHVSSVFVSFSFLGWFIVAAQRCLFECLSCVWIVIWHDSSFVLWLSTSVSLVYVDEINWNEKEKKNVSSASPYILRSTGWIDNKLFKVERFTHSLLSIWRKIENGKYIVPHSTTAYYGV